MGEGIVLFFGVIFFAIAVSFVAHQKHYTWWAWLILGLFFLPCAMFAIAFAPDNRSTEKGGPCKTCIWCKEAILKKAIICPFCGNKQNKPPQFSFSQDPSGTEHAS